MIKADVGPKPARGLLRYFLRVPIYLYRWRLGWVLGHRFVLLTHLGRKSGLPRNAVLEVVRDDQANGVVIVASGWGHKSDWFQNVQRNPRVTITLGRRRLTAEAISLPPAQAELELRDYARRHPIAFRHLSRFMIGGPFTGTSAEYQRLAMAIPLVSFKYQKG